MAYVPDIVSYKPFYIETKTDNLAFDTRHWGLVAKTNPFPILPTPKAPFANAWKDESGDDEYVDKLHYEAYEFEVSFYIKCFDSDTETAEVTMRKQIDEFFSLIKDGEFKIYDSYTGVGRQKVRYAGYTEESFKRGNTKDGDWARAIFKLKFKVNDPITRLEWYNGKLVEVV